MPRCTAVPPGDARAQHGPRLGWILSPSRAAVHFADVLIHGPHAGGVRARHLADVYAQARALVRDGGARGGGVVRVQPVRVCAAGGGWWGGGVEVGWR